MDSPLWIRRIASARIMLTSTVFILGHCNFWTSWGTVFVTTTWGRSDNREHVWAEEEHLIWQHSRLMILLKSNLLWRNTFDELEAKTEINSLQKCNCGYELFLVVVAIYSCKKIPFIMRKCLFFTSPSDLWHWKVSQLDFGCFSVLTSSMADSSMRRGASADNKPCVAMI